MPAPLVAVQIVNYRTRTYLERCLPSIAADLQQSGVPYELNLLDNASGERLDDLPDRFPGCRTFVAERNLGFGGGHNRLAAETAATYLWILNPDVEVISSPTLSRLLGVLTASERVQAVGPKLLTAQGDAQPYDHGRLTGVRARIALNGGHSYWRATDVRRRVAWVSGAAMLIERTAFTAVGGFDENLFLYKEEEDLCLRLRAAGGQVMYEPGVCVHHVGSVVADRVAGLAAAERYFIAKHCGHRRAQRVYAAAHRGLAYLHL